MKIYFHTLGCKVNQYETQSMRELFNAGGHQNAEKANEADIIVINSCTVTAESDRKTRQLIRRCRRENPDCILILTGCMAQAFPEISESLPEADIIIGNCDHRLIVETALNYNHSQGQIVNILPHTNGEHFNTPEISSFCERTRAYMKIEDGCDRFCSYCIIPKARGRVRSRSIESIKSEAYNLSKNGFKEIVLVGINLSAYGKDENYDLCDAVDAVCKTEGILRVRLGSLEPDHITDEMLKRLSEQPKFCPQFHLSLQSGCDETLKRMNRHYNSDFYRDLITRIRKMFPDAAITTDIMVGFAGETDEEFEKSLNFAKEIGFAKSHIFMYSRRSGTVAAALKSQVSNAVKQERSHKMINVTSQSEKEFLNLLCGKEYDVLFETYEDGYAQGYTANYSLVKVKCDIDIHGQLLPVKIISSEKDFCIGILNKKIL